MSERALVAQYPGHPHDLRVLAEVVTSWEERPRSSDRHGRACRLSSLLRLVEVSLLAASEAVACPDGHILIPRRRAKRTRCRFLPTAPPRDSPESCSSSSR